MTISPGYHTGLPKLWLLLQRLFRLVLLWIFCVQGMSVAALLPNQVLVIFNSPDAASLAVWQHYQSKHPGVHGFDLNNPAVSPGTISHAEFVTTLRTPLRAHLESQDLADQILVLVLTKGLPHRIQDLQAGNVGDLSGEAYDRINAGKATYASVDSELTLLWQDLEEGEAGGAMDSAADNRVENPYFNQSSPVSAYNRSAIRSARHFENGGAGRWRMMTRRKGELCTPGDMYLVSRLDGNSVEAVVGMINRALTPWYDPETDLLIQDRNAAGTFDGGDYTLTRTLMTPLWPAFLHEETNTFLIGSNGDLPAGNPATSRITGRVAALTGYGGNHDGYNRSGFIGTYAGQLATGAVYSGYESYNARKFGGTGGFGDQGQLSDWIDAGGTFGVGNAWEPLASGAPRNYALLKRYFIDGLSWVEAAWSSAPFLSWQTVVIGDPLAVASFTPPPTVGLSASGSLSETSDDRVTVTVELSAAQPTDMEIGLAFSGADPGSDFDLIGGPFEGVTIQANARTASFEIAARADDLPEGTEQLEIRIESGGGYQTDGSPVVIPIGDSPLGNWLVENFAAESGQDIASPDADPDGDGIANLIEYAMGLDPRTHDRDTGPILTSEATPEGRDVVYRFPINPAATDVTWEVESSKDLLSWLPHPAAPSSSPMDNPTMEARSSMAGEALRFFRLRVNVASD